VPDVVAGSGTQPHLRDSWRIPLVRATLPPLVAASVGIGTLFSLGITFVRETLGASEAQFGVLVIVFGLGAAAGLAARQFGRRGGVWAVRLGVQMMGAVLILMAFAGGLGLTLLMALVFGASGAYAIVSGITSLQTDLDPRDRLLALGSFHVIVRMALAAGALAAGLAADLLGSGVFGLGAVRSVMLVSGLVVALSAALVRDVVAD
jgi:predicted MFS family arabinose efflux permease